MSDWTIVSPLRLFAPAKVNLALEVLGRRDDGFHDVITLMETVSLFDVIDIHPAPHKTITSPDHIPDEDDLTSRALDLLEHASGKRLCLHVTVRKSIPVAAGLGGGSSNAGTVIDALGNLLGLSVATRHQLASQLGSDVPFFLSGGLAMARGTGTDITPIPSVGRRWYVIAIPQLQITGKTGTLYRALKRSDFSDGTRARELAVRINRGAALDPALVVNTFQRPLRGYPEFREIVESFERSGSKVTVPSGAGPSVFTMFDTFREAAEFKANLSLPESTFRCIATSIGPHPNQSRLDSLAPST